MIYFILSLFNNNITKSFVDQLFCLCVTISDWSIIFTCLLLVSCVSSQAINTFFMY